MRGSDKQTGSLFSYVNLEERVPARHPVRKIKSVMDAALASLDADFEALYADEGRPSIAPERLLRAALVQILFSIRSERQLMEQLEYNLLFRWFVGLSLDEPVWVPTVFTKNRDWLLTTDMSRKLIGDPCAREGGAAVVGRSLLRRRHAGRGMGLVQELQAEDGCNMRSTARRSVAARCRKYSRHRLNREGEEDRNGGCDW